MNAIPSLPDRIREAGRQVARHAPLTVRTLELLAVLALYASGLVFVDELSGTARFPVAVYAMFLLPVVLSVGVRWARTFARRLGVADHAQPHVG